MNRRTFLSGAVGTATASVAGCFDGSGSDPGPAAFVNFTTDTAFENGRLDAATVDVDALAAYNDGTYFQGLEIGGSQGVPVRLAVGGLDATTSGSRAAVQHAVGYRLGGDDVTDRAHRVGDAVVLEGSFDAEEIATGLEAEGFVDVERRDYSLYESEHWPSVVAFDDEFIAVIDETESGSRSDPGRTEARRESVTAIGDAATGEIALAVDDDGKLDELARAVSGRDVTTVGYHRDIDLFQPYEDAVEVRSGGRPEAVPLDGHVVGFAGGFDLDFREAGDEVTVELAIRYSDDATVDDEETLLDAVAGNAADAAVSVDGPTATVEGTYEVEQAFTE